MNPIEEYIDVYFLRGIYFGEINRMLGRTYQHIQLPQMCRARSVYARRVIANLDNKPNITTI